MAEIELLTLANHAEVQNGLLYMSGAGWDRVTRAYKEGNKPRPQHFSIALSVLVPWSETNQRHEVMIRVEDEDGLHKLMEAKANIEVGRPPGKVPGTDSRSPLVVTGIVQFPKAGGYRVESHSRRRATRLRLPSNRQSHLGPWLARGRHEIDADCGPTGAVSSSISSSTIVRSRRVGHLDGVVHGGGG